MFQFLRMKNVANLTNYSGSFISMVKCGNSGQNRVLPKKLHNFETAKKKISEMAILSNE